VSAAFKLYTITDLQFLPGYALTRPTLAICGRISGAGTNSVKKAKNNSKLILVGLNLYKKTTHVRGDINVYKKKRLDNDI
jgi:hypothetical protein